MGKSILITMAAVAVIFTTGVGNVDAVMIVEDFEGIPNTYLRNGGDQNLDGYLPGLDFGPHVTILDRVRYGYNDTGYPPHSGDAVIFSDPYDYMRVDFLGLPCNYVEIWYTANNSATFYLEAYDVGDNLLDSASGPGNYGSNALISVSGNNISYVKMHDTGNYFTLDDLGYVRVPEPATLSLLALGGLALIRRRRNK